MRLRNVRGSRNIEDRRGRGGVAMGGGLGVGGLLIVLAIGYFTGIDVTPLLTGSGTQTSEPRELTQAEVQAGDFSAQVLGTTEAVWTEVFPEAYKEDAHLAGVATALGAILAFTLGSLAGG